MWNGILSYKLQKEHSRDDAIPKIWRFLLIYRILFKILYGKDLM